MISIIHPSRGRAWKSKQRMLEWIGKSTRKDFEIIVSLDLDDPELPMYLHYYEGWGHLGYTVMSGNNRSCVDAINSAAKEAKGDIFIVVSDDTGCEDNWDELLLHWVAGKEDYLLKTDDGIQDYIVTMTVMDRKYYERDGFIYHPDFRHLFADTYLTCLADIRGRLLFSKLKFPHLHYSYSAGKEAPDELHKRNDGTWQDGERTFINLMRQAGDVRKIKDVSMQNWLRNHGVR